MSDRLVGGYGHITKKLLTNLMINQKKTRPEVARLLGVRYEFIERRVATTFTREEICEVPLAYRRWTPDLVEEVLDFARKYGTVTACREYTLDAAQFCRLKKEHQRKKSRGVYWDG